MPRFFTPLRRGLVYFSLHVISLIGILAISKGLMAKYGFAQVLFFRSCAPCLAIFGWMAAQSSFRPWRSSRWPKHMLRGFVGFGNMVLLYLSVKLLPLALAMTIRQLEAFCWVGLAAMLYGEKVSRRQWAALGVGFLGVLLVLRPAVEANLVGAIIALGCAVSGAFVRVLTRDLSRTEDSGTIIFFNFTQWTALSALALPWGWTEIADADWAPFFVTGVIVLVSQWLMTESLRLVPAAQLAPWRNSEIFWSGLVGWLVWRESIGPWFVVGSVLIIAAGIAANWRGERIPIQIAPLAVGSGNGQADDPVG